MTSNVLTQNASKQEIKEWLKLKDKRVEVDPSNPSDINKKINEVIKEQIKNSSDDAPADDSSNHPTDTPTGNGDDNKKVITKKDRIQTVEVKYQSGVNSTSWTVDFDLDKGQRLDQIGFNDLLRKILIGHLIYDADRNAFWIYDSKRWMPLNSHNEDLRQFTMQAVNIFIQNVQSDRYDIRYDPEEGLYLLASKPIQEENENDKDFKQRLAQYKADVNKVKRYNVFINFIQRPAVINEALKSLKSSMKKSNIPWDYDDYLLNVQNGVVNLKTGELIPHDKDLYLTRIAPVNYDPKASHPILDRTLSITFQKDEELKKYMQRQAGYFLVGGNRAMHLFLWYGPSARNGKSVLENTFARILGSEQKDNSGYAKSVPVETFLSSKFGDSGKEADPNLASLQGVRLAIASEPDRNAKLAGGKVKKLTGDRTITTRFLHQDTFSFEGKFKILISCNFLPGSDGDASIKRRMSITPFKHHIKEGSLEDDPFVLDKLWSEREGIFSWMVQGAIENEQTLKDRGVEKEKMIKKLQAEGKSLKKSDTAIYEDPLLPRPASVTEAIDKYIYSANSVSQFLHESVISKHDYWQYLVHNVFKKFDLSNYHIVYGPNNKNHSGEREFDSKYLKEQKLLALPNAYILCSDLYKLYQNYCSSNGIVHPVSAHNFYDMSSRYLVPARLHQGRVFLGVCTTPAAGYEDGHDWQLYKNWVESPTFFKERIYRAAESAINAVRNNDLASFETQYYRITLTDKDTVSKQQVLKLAKSVRVNPDLYFGRLIGTLDNSDIDFKREMDEVHGGVDFIDSENESMDDKKLEAIFG